jgi:hypothetical protein
MIGGVTGMDDDRVLPYDVQAAFNNDTFFWRVSYRGNEGKRHEYIRYTNGACQREGGDRRDGQGTIDGDAAQEAPFAQVATTFLLPTLLIARYSMRVRWRNLPIDGEGSGKIRQYP